MFKAIAMFFAFFTSLFSAANRLASATDNLAATAEDLSLAFREEQSETNRQRLEKLKAYKEHAKANPEQFEF